MTLRELKRLFEECFEGSPQVACAPGRVNLIGEHTDYNSGFAMPFAIDRRTAARLWVLVGVVVIIRTHASKPPSPAPCWDALERPICRSRSIATRSRSMRRPRAMRVSIVVSGRPVSSLMAL